MTDRDRVTLERVRAGCYEDRDYRGGDAIRALLEKLERQNEERDCDEILRVNLREENERLRKEVEQCDGHGWLRGRIDAALALLEHGDKVRQVCPLCRVQLWCTFRDPQRKPHAESCVIGQLVKALKGEVGAQEPRYGSYPFAPDGHCIPHGHVECSDCEAMVEALKGEEGSDG